MKTGEQYYIRHIYQIEADKKEPTTHLLKRVLEQRIQKLSSQIKVSTSSLSETMTIIESFGFDHTLQPTKKDRVWYGKHLSKVENLLVVGVSKSGETIVIDFFPGYYPEVGPSSFELLTHHDFSYLNETEW